MKKKEKLIIEQSMKLFAEKGFNATSIQEIATACGISKGAFYLHFKSKEALLLAILNHYFQLMYDKLIEIEEEDLEPRDKFMKQIECQVREICRHKEFLIMQARENAIPYNDDIEAFIFKMRLETHRFYQKRLLAIYGDTLKTYFWDLSIALQGIQHSFLHVMMIDKVDIDYNRFARFMLQCADDMEAGFRKRTESPVINPSLMDHLFKERLNDETILVWLVDLKREWKDEDIRITLDVIESEIESGKPRIPVLRGMIANLEEESGLHEFMNVIKEYYNVK
ncbi:TetR/AcrR family transcriptional regulator [Domibacillus epiphyticus]|uniref:TetR family transcriptional regulator n=1 Tax=Domibacillus epiphyticus TaxID=1714355 RepID=A0A1V2AA58_9BACI|nr:TetR/AcrR family transcriptional regulator [Domibacillus epiphyticus]OMP67886.1 TetR family transcriptional regulator [Domibacillus epiphyticus]